MSLILEAHLSWHKNSTGPSKMVSSQREPSSHSALSWSFCVFHVPDGSSPLPRPETKEESRTLPSPSSFTPHQMLSVSLSCSCSIQALPGLPTTLSLPGPNPLPSHKDEAEAPTLMPHPHLCSLHSPPLWSARPQQH